MKDNSKVPTAILCSFLIAFILQGVLKVCGIFIFEKALTWELFKIIDNIVWIKLIFYSIIVFIVMYCLSFAFTSKHYSTKWFHYIILIFCAFLITSIKLFTKYDISLQILYDCITYIIIPLIIKFTSDKNDKMFDNFRFYYNIITISIQILLYFCYLGLTYWSSLTASIIISKQVLLPASTSFLIYFEVYLGLILLMLTTNNIVKLIKGGKNDISS